MTRHPPSSFSGVKLSRRHKTIFYSVTSAVWLTGALWLYFRWRGGVTGSEWGEVRHPGESLMLKTHGAAAMVFLASLGAVVPVHMKRGWRQRRNRFSGLFMACYSVFLAATGWYLYYGAGEAARALVSAAHWGAGILLPALIAGHVFLGRRTRGVKEDRRPDHSRGSPNRPP